MSEAAQVEIEEPQELIEATQETPETESAPVEQAESPAEPKVNGVQERINKITAAKYEQQRRADEAERKLQELQSQQQKPVSDARPKLEDFDYDEARFQEALIDYKVEQKAQQLTQHQEQQRAQQRQSELNQTFNSKVASFVESAPDYQEVVGNIPMLPPETLETVMQSEKGPQLAYYLGQHLDIADEIANSSPMAAAMRLGEISATLKSQKQTIKPSAAPEPIESIPGGASVAPVRGPKGATFE